MRNKGFVLLPILILIAIVALGAGIYINSKKVKTSVPQTELQTSTITITETPSSIPTSVPTPPPTKKPQPTLTKATTPTPAVNISDCSRFKPEDGLATITINLKEKDGKTLIGDWIVKIKPTGSCPAILPYGNQPLTNVIHQGTYTYTSVGFHTGQVRVDVEYHYTGEGFDVDATSGNHSRDVTVSN